MLYLHLMKLHDYVKLPNTESKTDSAMISEIDIVEITSKYFSQKMFQKCILT